MMDIKFMASAADFRAWLAENHATATELWVGFYNKASGEPSITYQEAVDEALCFGWIDGLRKNVDETSYKIRFTPRKRTSIWSAVNLKKYEALVASGRMAEPGRAMFESRDPKRAGLYSTENRHVQLDPAFVKRFQAKRKAWAFFEAQPPGYRRLAGFWVMNAKREETRERRFATLVADSAAHRRVAAIADTPASAAKHVKRK